MIKIVTDSVASIPDDMLKGSDIEVVSLFVNRDGVEYEDATMDLDAFYVDIHDMLDNIPVSSQPSQKTLEDLFSQAAEDGDEVLGVFISSKMSGTFEGALRAARAVHSRNIDFKYAIVDSSSNSFDEAWAVFEAVEAAKEGRSLSDCVKAVLKAIKSSRFLFTPESLTFLQKGGRIGNAAALLGNLIKLSPVLTVADGEATTAATVRTRKKALETILRMCKEDIEAHGLKNVVVHYIGDRKPADVWAQEVIEPFVGHSVRVLPVSPVIGCHVGPAVGISYECENEISGKLSTPAQALVCTS